MTDSNIDTHATHSYVHNPWSVRVGARTKHSYLLRLHGTTTLQRAHTYTPTHDFWMHAFTLCAHDATQNMRHGCSARRQKVSLCASALSVGARDTLYYPIHFAICKRSRPTTFVSISSVPASSSASSCVGKPSDAVAHTHTHTHFIRTDTDGWTVGLESCYTSKNIQPHARNGGSRIHSISSK